MTSPENVIAWLVPTARGTFADRATQLPANTFRTIATPLSPFLTSRLPNLMISQPQKAIQVSFDQAPKRPGSFILGTDPRTCDIVLPSLPGISRQHCSLRFDGQSRLVLEDFSDKGTQVWYDWESSGDRTDYTWVLSSAPGTNERITIDIQGIRFQVVLNDYPDKDVAAYEKKVDEFCKQPSWVDGLTIGWDRVSVPPVAPLFDATPFFRHIFVKGLLRDEPRGEIYLWNMARPWEPMVKASA